MKTNKMKRIIFILNITLITWLTSCYNISNEPANQIDATKIQKDTLSKLNLQKTNIEDTAKSNKGYDEKDDND
jgi:hypothetical protein